MPSPTPDACISLQLWRRQQSPVPEVPLRTLVSHHHGSEVAQPRYASRSRGFLQGDSRLQWDIA